MAAKYVGSRHPVASVVRDQAVRPDFQHAMNTSNSAHGNKDIPKRFRELLDRLDQAEGRKKKDR